MMLIPQNKRLSRPVRALWIEIVLEQSAAYDVDVEAREGLVD